MYIAYKHEMDLLIFLHGSKRRYSGLLCGYRHSSLSIGRVVDPSVALDKLLLIKYILHNNHYAQVLKE